MPAAKTSYTIPCSSAFRDQVLALAERRGVNVGDLARSVMLVVPPEAIDATPDPGEPAADDREDFTVMSGHAAGTNRRRKPRLQVRLPPGHNVPRLRRALGLALAMAAGERTLKVETPATLSADARLADAQKEIERLRSIVGTLSFRPLAQGVKTRGDALYVLGFPQNAKLGPDLVKSRFRMLASIHHPDSPYGDTRRMSQLNQAMEKLRALGIYR